MLNQKVTHTQVGDFYNSSIITRFWSHLKQRHMHVGYWDDEHPFQYDFYEGAVRFTDFMISLTGITEGESFIDIGCGYGVPAVALAKRKQCIVYGVTASQRQQEYAQEFARAELPVRQTQFLTADANHLPFADGMFEGGWFFESIFHIGHETALREANRVLKTGAELLIADFIKTGDLRTEERDFLEHELGIKSAVTLGEYPALIERTGFTLKELKDLTANTLDMEKRWQVHLEIIEKKEDNFFETVDEKSYHYMKRFFSTLHEIAKHNIGYCVVKAEK